MIQGERKKPKRSLRWVLALWFLTFAIIPIVFLTFYSLGRFQRAMDNELALRLKGHASEINIIIGDYLNSLNQEQKLLLANPLLLSLIQSSQSAPLKEFLEQWIDGSTATALQIYNPEGHLKTKVFHLQNSLDSKNEVANPLEAPHPTNGAIKIVSLHENILKQLKSHHPLHIVEFPKPEVTALNLISPIKRGKLVLGYLQQTLMLSKDFLEKVAHRMQVQALLLEPNGRTVASSHSDFNLYPPDFFIDLMKIPQLQTFNLALRGEPFGFIFSKIAWGESQFTMVLGASKKVANETLKNLRIAYLSLLAIMFGVLILFVVAASKVVLQPLSELVDAIHDFHLGENLIELPVKTDNEIGQLTTSFNDLSRRILKAQRELRNKISELEETNIHLKDTQGQLVHSAKMASLGQLVAGVAHELNNPIGFIYSNMTPLREYSEGLLRLVECAENNPQALQKMKEDLDLDFIKKDLPRLIGSCEDGARRTKEIVLGLRNFSRIEENVLNPTDIHLAIDTTLNLLNSEFKNRIEIKKDYGAIPMVVCNPTQINQVLMNILSNAAQAIKGKGQVWITTKVLSTSSESPPQVSISIQDSGLGIPDEIRQKIFDPFFTTKSIGQGTGLGLAISYGIIQSHGGQIEVHSQLGEGTEFIITLPIHSPKSEQDSHRSKE